MKLALFTLGIFLGVLSFAAIAAVLGSKTWDREVSDMFKKWSKERKSVREHRRAKDRAEI